MKLDSIVARKPLLESIQYGMTPGQRRIVEGIVREFMPLYEATLTKDQIDQLFGTIEKDPSSRTMIGKGVDVAKKANEILGKVGRWMQDETPVKGFDEKFEQLKKKISDQHPELAKRLTAMGTWAKENPGKTAAIIGVLTSIAAIASGGTGGAIAGQVLRGATELLKGEKLSTAIGRGAKTAAIGYGLGKLADWTKEIISTAGGDRIVQYTFGKDLRGQVNFDPSGKITGDIITSTGKTISPSDPAYSEVSKRVLDLMKQSQADSVKSAAEIGAFMKDSIDLQQRPLSEGQVYLVFQRLDEGPFDAVKKVAGKAAGAVGGAIKKGAEKVGTALTQKTSASGLAKAWTKAGSPTDSDELYKFLLAQKINKDALDKIYGDMKLPVPQNVQEPQAEPEVTGGDATGTKPSTATATDTEPTQIPSTATTVGAVPTGTFTPTSTASSNLDTMANEIKQLGSQAVKQVIDYLKKELGKV